MSNPTPLKPEELEWKCDECRFDFETTDDIEPLKEIIGQERALRALDFGLELSNHGFNIYVLGESGTGKITTVKAMVEKKAASEPTPDDWCYIFDFENPDKPKGINLPPGTGSAFKADMEKLIQTTVREIPKIFESKDYEEHRDEILEGQQERTKDIFHKLELLAAEKNFILKKSAGGIAVVPAKDGKPLKAEEYEAMSSANKRVIDEAQKFLQDRLSDAIREARKVEKETKERIDALDKEVVQYLVNPLTTELLEKYKGFEVIVEHLNAVRNDIFINIDDFRPGEEFAIPGIKLPRQEPTFERYAVNVIVNNAETKGAPVEVETNPTYYNLFGRIEHRIQYGVASTDFTMIKGGSAHRANGGYLVVDALDVLRNIFVYEALKRMIKNREVKIEDAWEQYRMMSTATLKPSAIPIDVKVVLVGDPRIYYLLYRLDNEYRKLFKVKADFDNVMPITDETITRYAEFVAARCKEEKLLPFDRSAVARVVEFGARKAGDKKKLTARFNDVANLVVEAAYWAKKSDATKVSSEHIEKAVKEKRYRNAKIEDKLQEFITEDTIMVDTEGEVEGQVNGIAVLDFGDYSFGKPSRVTAKTFLGDVGVVNIEREVKMSGRIHNKALMILTSFLGERFAQKVPLTLSASVCFEQLYEEIEGDSATCTEVYALLSSLSGLPLNQGIAATGSMNQKGEVQPVGGINDKIEGFFDVCKAKGLTGKQGVVMPSRNVKNLILKKEVVDAVKEGKFNIYPIAMVDEGLAILTGREVGEKDKSGNFGKGTVNRLAADRLKELATSFKAFGRPKPKGAAKKKADKDEE